jgi:hypothetical protein
LFPAITNTLNSEESSHLHFRNPSGEENLYLASLDKAFVFYPKANNKKKFHHDSISVASSASENNDKNETLKFAFSVHKFTSTGEAITKGPKVEGRYKIQYAMPALEGELDTYLDAEGLATYASADLPAVKLLIIVSDISKKNPVTVLTQTIDFNVAFGYTRREIINEEKHIVVTIYLSDD